jgi:hypothetical protein
VLFVGNSYTYVNMLPEMLQKLAIAGGQSMEYRMITPGGSSLNQNWDQGLAPKAIAEGGWDYVVLQEQSLRPITNAANMHIYARLFDGEVRKAGARTVFYVTWPRKNAPDQQATLTAAYSSIATELGALSCPVGPAWAGVHKKQPDLELYQSDGSHPSPEGTYLAACVFYNVLFGKSPVGLPRTIIGRLSPEQGANGPLAALSPEVATLLQKTALQTVKEWNGGKTPPARR